MSIELKPLLFIPRENFEAIAKIYYLDFPSELIEALKPVYGAQFNRDKITLPVKTLNAAIVALFPEVISSIDERNFKTGRRWLIATRDVDVALIKNVIKVWINEEIFDKAKEEDSSQVKRAEEILESAELQWECIETKIFQDNKFNNGTINPEDGYFDAVPEYLCNKLCSLDKGFSVNGITLHFKRSGKAEMMSWPPQFYESKDKRYYYSLVLTFSVQTMPFYSQSVILMKVSTRRFVSASLVAESGYVKLPYDNDTSVLLSTQSYWYDRNQSSAFTKAKLGYNFLSKEIFWVDKLSKILNALNISSSLPEAKELAEEPLNYIDGNTGINAVILKSNFTDDNHYVGTGVSMKDLRELSNQVSESLSELQKLDEVKRINLKMKYIDLLEGPLKIQAKKIRQAIADIIEGTLKLEIRYEADEVKEALSNAITNIFGLEEFSLNNGIYKTPELEIGLDILPVGNKISTALEGKSGHIDRVKYIQSAIHQIDICTGTFVELSGKSNWNKKNPDPKGAVREGFGKTGRLTQFITPADEDKSENNLEIKARNAVCDMLRQIGYMPSSPKIEIKKGTIPGNLNLFGLWLINTNTNDSRKSITFPVAVYMNTTSNTLKVKCPIFNNSWLDYRKALLEIVNYSNLSEMKEEKNNKFKLSKCEIHKFIRLLMNEISELGPSLLLVDATNLRSSWGWIADKNINKKQIWVGELKDKDKDECKLNMSRLKNLRIIRTRSGEEIADYYGLAEQGEKFTSGFYEPIEGMFWSLASKPITMVSSKLGRENGSRIETPTKDFKYPNLLEVAPIFIQEGDNANEWGYAVHKMRNMLPHYNEASISPAPLHLAKKIEEYICQVE